MTTLAQTLVQAVGYHQRGHLAQAEQLYRQVLQADPQHVDALHLLGVIAHQVGKSDLAIDYLSQAVRLNPHFAEAHNNLGNALKDQGKLAAAAASYRQALHLKPNLAEVHNNLGSTLQGQGELAEAVACYRQALRLKPDYAEAHNNLGGVLQGQGELDEAVACYRQALRLKPDLAEAHNILGSALRDRGELDEAVACCRQALRLKPDYADAHNILGNALHNQGKLDEAMACFHQALHLKPDLAEAHLNRALTWLRRGDFEEGWPEYEWRWKCKGLSPPPFRQALWDGTPLDGRSILLHAEQGLGDVLQFIRYAPLVQQRGGRVIVACPRPLIRLLASCPGIDELVARDAALPAFEVYAPLMSLPRIFGTTLASIPAEVPYLRADEALVEDWHRELGPIRSFKIGIAWQGSLKYRGDRHRSFRLTQFAPLSRLSGVRLFSLQKGPGMEQLREVTNGFDVTDLGSRLDDFVDTAAVMKNLDLVISADSAPAHLAGALGVPIWVALPFASDWRWLLEREDSPWYPTMRLFRQSRWRDWDGVFDRIAGALEARLRTAARAKSIAIEVAPGELLDKITILEIKSERLTDSAKLGHVRVELSTLMEARDRALGELEGLSELTVELKAVNEALWEIEDGLRACERGGDFGPRFIELARSAYHTNDWRAALKRRINERLGSESIEEKAYAPYEEPGSPESRSSGVAFGKESQ
jgi:tetratricopeptide (TPR) repeat protein